MTRVRFQVTTPRVTEVNNLVFFWRHEADKLSSRPGIKPMPPAVEAESITGHPPGSSLSNQLLSPLYHTCKLAVSFLEKRKCKINELYKQSCQI